MADFLTRLVHRTLGQAPIVQPRIGSIFESGLEILDQPAQFSEHEHSVEIPHRVSETTSRPQVTEDTSPTPPPPPALETQEQIVESRTQVELNRAKPDREHINPPLVESRPEGEALDTPATPGQPEDPVDELEIESGPTTGSQQAISPEAADTPQQHPVDEARRPFTNHAEIPPTESADRRLTIHERHNLVTPESDGPNPMLVGYDGPPATSEPIQEPLPYLGLEVRKGHGPISQPARSAKVREETQASPPQNAFRSSRSIQSQTTGERTAYGSTLMPHRPEQTEVPEINAEGLSEPVIPFREQMTHREAHLVDRGAPTNVRVSIGRIEIRANTTSEPQSQPVPPVRRGPTLSLDDYLKKRNEGQR